MGLIQCCHSCLKVVIELLALVLGGSKCWLPNGYELQLHVKMSVCCQRKWATMVPDHGRPQMFLCGVPNSWHGLSLDIGQASKPTRLPWLSSNLNTPSLGLFPSTGSLRSWKTGSKGKEQNKTNSVLLETSEKRWRGLHGRSRRPRGGSHSHSPLTTRPHPFQNTTNSAKYTSATFLQPALSRHPDFHSPVSEPHFFFFKPSPIILVDLPVSRTSFPQSSSTRAVS